MDEGKPKHRDRYDITGNVEAEYVDEECTVLVNKLGIADLEALQVREEEGLAQAYEALLNEVRVDTPMTCDLLLFIHRRIFGDLYEWAGRWRTVVISKPGITWPPPKFLAQNMQTFERVILQKYTANKLMDEEAFCEGLAEVQGEFLTIHPFREGNARTIKLLSDLLSAQTGRPLLKYDTSEEGCEEYIAAASAAFMKNYEPLVEIIRRALAEAQP